MAARRSAVAAGEDGRGDRRAARQNGHFHVRSGAFLSEEETYHLPAATTAALEAPEVIELYGSGASMAACPSPASATR